MPTTTPTPPANVHRLLMFTPAKPTDAQVSQSENFQKIAAETKTDSKTGDTYRVFQGNADLDGDGAADSINGVEGPMGGKRMFNSLFSDAKKGWYFATQAERGDRSPVSELRIGDVNGDGRVDVLVMLENGAALFLENTGEIKEVEISTP